MKWDILNNSRNKSPKILGFRAENYLETGYVYAPYIPLVISESEIRIRDPWLNGCESWFLKEFLSNYCTTHINQDYFGIIKIS